MKSNRRKTPEPRRSRIYHSALTLLAAASFLLAPAARGAHEWFLPDRPMLQLAGGVAGVLDDEQIGAWGLEYRPAFRFYHFGPWFQVGRGSEHEVYASLGVLIHLHLGHNWILTPSFGGGYYNDNEGLDLGFDAQFRSSLELAKRFRNGHEVAIGFTHLSNGSLSDQNPGTESLMIHYAFPLDVFFRKPPAPAD